MATNTTKSLQKKSTSQEHEELLTKAKQKFDKEKQVEVSLPESMRKSVGNELFVSINGVKLVLEVGKKHKVPESFASFINDYKDNLTN